MGYSKECALKINQEEIEQYKVKADVSKYFE